LRCGSVIALVLATTACSEPVFCTDDTRPAVELEVRDRTTAELIRVEAKGVVQDGVYQDSLRPFWQLDPPPITPLSYSAAYERAGTYSAHIEVTGYQAWDTSGIRVTEDQCHVHTARFTAALEASP
jgi:hypothetical protein